VKNHFSRLSLLLLSLCSTTALSADLLSVYRSALSSDPVLLAEVASKQAVGELRQQATARFLPEVSLSANSGRVERDASAVNFGGSQEYNTHGYSLNLTQPIYRYQNYVQNRQADIAVERAQANYFAAEQSLIVRVAERYFAFLASQDDVMFAKAEKTANEKQLEQVQQRFDVGLATITDLLESQSGFDLSSADVISAENAWANSQARLRETAGQDYEHLASLTVDTPLISPQPADLAEWSAMALEHNPSLQVAVKQKEEAAQSVSLQRSGHHPSLDLVGQRSYTSQSDSSFGGGSQVKQDSISLQLSVPIYEGGAVSSRVREAHHRLNEAMQKEEERRRGVMRESREAYNGVLSGISRVKAFKQAVVSADKALESMEAGYEVGTRTTTDVLNGRRDLFRAKRDYASARYDYILSSLRLKQATGIVSAADLEQINNWLEE